MSITVDPTDRIREQAKSSAAAVKEQLDATRRTIAEEAGLTGQALKDELKATVGATIDNFKASTAGRLSQAAESVGEHARNTGSPTYRRAAEQVASGLGHASGYVSETSLCDARADVRANIGRNPGRWVCGALAVGFLTGIFIDSLGRRSSARREAC